VDPQQIRITAEPVDSNRCRFVLPQPVHQGVRRFASLDEARGSPLAERIFAIPELGVTEVVISGSTITVGKSNPAPWTTVGRQVGQAIREALSDDRPPLAPRSVEPVGEGPAAGVNDDALYERVADVFEQQVNPMVARHGGRVELIDVQEGTVMLRMSGGCQGCGMADVTLRQGIEGVLARFVPEIKGVVDITDHSAGTSPYFQSAKK
jgi:Fe-S cluster biogenesis protein NfuA